MENDIAMNPEPDLNSSSPQAVSPALEEEYANQGKNKSFHSWFDVFASRASFWQFANFGLNCEINRSFPRNFNKKLLNILTGFCFYRKKPFITLPWFSLNID